MFYTYNQNNSGGVFDFDEKSGITHYVIIEADNENEANSKAEEIGIYFNGVNEGRDCDCCGDRWYYPWKGTEVPSIYDEPVEKHHPLMVWMDGGKEVVVHYKNGDIKWLTFGNDEARSSKSITEGRFSVMEEKVKKAKAKAKKSGGKSVVIAKQKKVKAKKVAKKK